MIKINNEKQYIIWDWNGTLFDDIDICIFSMNKMLKRHSIKPIQNRQEYRKKFCFPVEKYYQNIGFCFSKTPFKILAKEFIDIYQVESFNSSLTKNALEILEIFKKNNYTQVVLSASKQDALKSQLEAFGISNYFEIIMGVDNYYAITKLDIAQKWVANSQILSSQIIIVGDTLHDFEVSKELGCKCILYANGHQHIENIDCYGIIYDLKDIIKYFPLNDCSEKSKFL